MFKAEKSALASAVETVKPAINNRNTIPILANVLIERDGDDLLVTGTNLDLQLSVRCAATIGGDFVPFTLPHALMQSAVKSMPDGPISVSNATPGPRLDAVALKSGRARIKIPILPAGDFPKLKGGSMTHSIGCGSKSLRQCLEGVSFAISTEETRIYLNGIFVEAQPEGLIFVATDGHRMARRLLPHTDLDDDVAELPHIIIPRNTVGAILSSLPKDDNVTLKLSEERMEMESGAITLISKFVEGTFPDYKRIIPANNDTKIRINTKALTSAIERVLTVSTDKGNGVSFAFQGDTLTLTSRPGSHGEAEDAVSTVGDADLSIGFNGKYLQEIIGAIGTDEVELALNRMDSPAIIRKPGETVSLSILMPMRIESQHE
ncbi:DNA polymerase III subunit beta [Rhizobium sp. 32-5/1]|uniref:DNA polymerase III subunit beta n=1 Tax=Rhizobium sp. 32-5/1 TaxID=3019602 RepID=UPI00240D31EA|nr:DNA polymerase III subunit beta [Rhizobium sp. 32-5/1]WEZ84609.1 DNA polymerase III subunit beta [Rhizobium sp. 32-5/1]